MIEQFKAAVHGNGVKVEIDADGNVTVYFRRPLTMVPPQATTDASIEPLNIAAKMPDGTIYACGSPDTKPIYVLRPKDAPMYCNFQPRQRDAAKLDALTTN